MRRDPYEVLGVARDADDARDQEGLPRARARAAPRRQPPRPRGRGEVQGGRRGLRDPRPTPSGAPPTTATASRGSTRAASRRRARLRLVRRHLRRVLRRRPVRRVRRPRGRRPRPGRRRRRRGRDLARGGRDAARSVEVAYDLVDACEHCHGNGAEPGTPIETCERCDGAGRCGRSPARPSASSCASRSATSAAATGSVPTQPCTECSGRGRKAVRKTLEVDVPAGIADEQRIRLTGRGHAGERGGPPGDLYVLVRVARGRALRARRQRPRHASSTSRLRPRRSARRVSVPTLDGRRGGRGPAGHPAGHGRDAARPGHARASAARGRGDQQVVLNVVIPRNLSERQRELLDGAARLARRRQPARAGRRVDRRQAAPRVPLIRLAFRAPAEAAEQVLAALLELAPAGFEQVDGDGWVEYALYGAPGELPSFPDGEADVGGVRGERARRAGRRRLGRALEASSTSPCSSAGGSGCARRGRRGARRARSTS